MNFIRFRLISARWEQGAYNTGEDTTSKQEYFSTNTFY